MKEGRAHQSDTRYVCMLTISTMKRMLEILQNVLNTKGN